MSPGEPQLSRLEELRLQRELKEILLENVRAIYGPRNPTSHGFDIVTHRTRLRKGDRETIIVRAIVYTKPNYAEWKILKEGGSKSFGIVAAFQEFLKDLQREMGEACGEMKEGETFGGKLPIDCFEDLLD